jgi:hypothetical protein
LHIHEQWFLALASPPLSPARLRCQLPERVARRLEHPRPHALQQVPVAGPPDSDAQQRVDEHATLYGNRGSRIRSAPERATNNAAATTTSTTTTTTTSTTRHVLKFQTNLMTTKSVIT